MSKITEGNKLLSEFMDLEIIDSGSFIGFVKLKENYSQTNFNIFIENIIERNDCFPYDFTYPQFSNSWDWLMFAVQKINSLDHLNLWHKYNVDRYNLTEAVDKVDIKNAFELCVDFVKRYNLETCH